MVQMADARALARKVERIEDAGRRGDWKADSWSLERHPASREEFGGASRNSGPEITVILNIPKPDPLPALVENGRVIEASASTLP